MSADQEATLCGGLNDRFYRSTVEIRAHISKEFGLRYSHSGCIKLLARLERHPDNVNQRDSHET